MHADKQSSCLSISGCLFQQPPDSSNYNTTSPSVRARAVTAPLTLQPKTKKSSRGSICGGVSPNTNTTQARGDGIRLVSTVLPSKPSLWLPCARGVAPLEIYSCGGQRGEVFVFAVARDASHNTACGRTQLWSFSQRMVTSHGRTW